VRELKSLRVGQLRLKFSHAGAQCADLSDQCVDGRLPVARRSAGGRSIEPTTSACAGRRGLYGRSLPSEPSERAGSLGPRGCDPGIALGSQGCRGKEDQSWTTITTDTSTLTTRRGEATPRRA